MGATPRRSPSRTEVGENPRLGMPLRPPGTEAVPVSLCRRLQNGGQAGEHSKDVEHIAERSGPRARNRTL